jgi:hypothetical protein
MGSIVLEARHWPLTTLTQASVRFIASLQHRVAEIAPSTPDNLDTEAVKICVHCNSNNCCLA